MAEEHDDLSDLWYPWLFATIHQFIAENLPENLQTRPRAVDADCGTGFQSFLLLGQGLMSPASISPISWLMSRAERRLDRSELGRRDRCSGRTRIVRGYRIMNARTGRKMLAPKLVVEDIVAMQSLTVRGALYSQRGKHRSS